MTPALSVILTSTLGAPRPCAVKTLPPTETAAAVGASSVQLILSDCIIFENYSTPAYAGKSFNIYDREDKKWHQTWVDKNGILTEFVGGIEDGRMIYVADEMRGGQRVLVKMTFTKLPDGDVRQFGEQSTDGGKTWAVRYDLIYSKKKE